MGHTLHAVNSTPMLTLTLTLTLSLTLTLTLTRYCHADAERQNAAVATMLAASFPPARVA